MGDTVCLDRHKVVVALRHLDAIVPSLARLGSAANSMTPEQHAKALNNFLDDWDVFRRLAEIRHILGEPFDYDELEHLGEGVAIWPEKPTDPKLA